MKQKILLSKNSLFGNGILIGSGPYVYSLSNLKRLRIVIKYLIIYIFAIILHVSIYISSIEFFTLVE